MFAIFKFNYIKLENYHIILAAFEMNWKSLQFKTLKKSRSKDIDEIKQFELED